MSYNLRMNDDPTQAASPEIDRAAAIQKQVNLALTRVRKANPNETNVKETIEAILED